MNAVRLTWKNWNDVCEFMGDHLGTAYTTETYSQKCGEQAPYIEMSISTPHGIEIVHHGDYIIKKDGYYDKMQYDLCADPGV